MDLFYLSFICGLLFASVQSAPQVPYDYIPIGRDARRREAEYAHASDVNHNYERLYPSGRKFMDPYRSEVVKYK
ncbi:unnamed protein product [Arctia plantaginis]|uniref:Uncharacterized protein n=1 Tax=Arctia plantaginis TaxID=874455 RepID=A0A8S1AH33_ARCPL|nr:unnamed protein product [Arctia plantaginis]